MLLIWHAEESVGRSEMAWVGRPAGGSGNMVGPSSPGSPDLSCRIFISMFTIIQLLITSLYEIVNQKLVSARLVWFVEVFTLSGFINLHFWSKAEFEIEPMRFFGRLWG